MQIWGCRWLSDSAVLFPPSLIRNRRVAKQPKSGAHRNQLGSRDDFSRYLLPASRARRFVGRSRDPTAAASLSRLLGQSGSFCRARSTLQRLPARNHPASIPGWKPKVTYTQHELPHRHTMSRVRNYSISTVSECASICWSPPQASGAGRGAVSLRRPLPPYGPSAGGVPAIGETRRDETRHDGTGFLRRQ